MAHLSELINKVKAKLVPHTPGGRPPPWTPAPEQPHKDAKYAEATEDEYERAKRFCNLHAVNPPKLLPSNVVSRLSQEGCKPWEMVLPTSDRFRGRVESGTGEGSQGMTRVFTDRTCKDVLIVSNLPIMAGLYDIGGMEGVYYEVVIQKMGGIIGIGNSTSPSLHKSSVSSFLLWFVTGSVCLPHPDWRFPGWERLSVGLHLDDFMKFYDDPTGGRDYTTPGFTFQSPLPAGVSIGFGYEFKTSNIFFTYNGRRLGNAFGGVYVPRERYDVYAAIGVEGDNEFKVNFGTERFIWEEGNNRAWKVEGLAGKIAGPEDGETEELPPYQESS